MHPLALIKRQRYISPSADAIISTSTYGGDVVGYYTSGTTNYAVHMFNQSGSFTLPSFATTNTVEVLLIGGGGSGGGSIYGGGGGGGGGGYVITSSYQLSAGVPVAIEIGAGGSATSSNDAFAQGNNGSPSTIGTGTANYVVSLGGGGGGATGRVPYLSSYSTATLSGLAGGQGGGAAGTNLNATYSGYFNTNGTYITFTSSNFNVSATDVVWTIECWVYMVTNNTYFFCIGNGSSYGNSIACGLNSSNFFTFYQSNGTVTPVSLTSSVSSSLNTWYHYAVSRTSGGVITLFVNGVQQATQTYNSAGIVAGTTVVVNGLYDNNGIGNNGGQFYISNLRFVKGIVVYSTNFTAPTKFLETTQSANVSGNPSAAITTSTSTVLLTLQSYGNNRWDVPDNSPYAYNITSVGTNTNYGIMVNPYYGNAGGGNIQPFTSYDNIVSGTPGASLQVSYTYVSSNPSTLEYIVVAGGGGGGGGQTSGYGAGGGGGGGGVVAGTLSLLVNDVINVTVGSGGAGATSYTYGTSGQNSTLITSFGTTNITAYGGGGGGYGDVTGLSGGSGGGPLGIAVQSTSTSGGYGNNGGSSSASAGYGGAGGGAGSAGLSYDGSSAPGGSATYTAFFDGSTQYLSVSGLPALGTDLFTAEAWVYVSSTGSSYTVYSTSATTAAIAMGIHSNGRPYAAVGITYGTIGEGSTLTLTPPAGYVMTSVLFGAYGSVGVTGPDYTRTVALSTATQSLIEGYCVGNSTASIPANNSVFGDPDSGHGKSLSVTTTHGLLGSTPLAINTWHHLALVRSGTGAGQTVFYVDGVSVGSGTLSTNYTNTPTYFIGASYISAAPVLYHAGYLTNTRIVKGIAVYTGAFTVPTPPLGATQSAGTNINAISASSYTHLLTLQNSTIIDNGGYTRSITNSGTVTMSLFGIGTGGDGIYISNFGSWGTTIANSTAPTSGKGYFGGGGGAGNWTVLGSRPGGAGGGAASSTSTVASSGIAFTGGGGGGGYANSTTTGGAGGDGGSGIVVIRHLNTYTFGNFTGSITTSSSGGYIYYAFTSTGSVTWPGRGGFALGGSWGTGGAGGGGAGGDGGNNIAIPNYDAGGVGGIGARYERTGAYYAGGGAGGPYFGGTGYTGGFGGGGDANPNIADLVSYTGVGFAGQPNTGGGGSTKTKSGAGGSGVVIVSYPLPSNIDPKTQTDPYFKYNTLLLSTIDTATTYNFPAAATTISATYSRPSAPPPYVEILVVAGGGGGGRASGSAATGGGGGGGGGVILTTATITQNGASTSIVVGAGGIAPTTSAAPGNGGNSSAWGYTATGGGYGGFGNTVSSGESFGNSGGCGGGGAGYAAVNSGYTNISYGTGGQGVTETSSGPFQGFPGGVGGLTGTSTTVPARGRGSGGGGGAGAAGGAGGALTTATTTDNASGNGGIGFYCPWSSYGGYYGGGGGGGQSNSGTAPTGGGAVAAGSGGAGGGGAGGTTGSTAGTAGTNGLGGGGGGARGQSGTILGGKGGTGTVVVRYLQIYSTATVTGSPTISVDRGYRYYQWSLPGSYSMSFPSQYTTLTNASNALYLDSSTSSCTISSLSQNIGGSPYQGTFTPYSNAWSVYFDAKTFQGRGISFNTGTQFVYGTGAVTIEAWVFPIYAEFLDRALFRQPDNLSGAANQTDIYIPSSSPYFRVNWGNTAVLTSTIPVIYSTWQHVAFVREGAGTNQAKLYINGVLAGVGTAAYNQTVTTDFPTIGSQVSPWVGYISNFRIVKGTAVYVGGTSTGTTYFSPPTSPLSRINGTSLLSCADHLFVDKSVYNNQLTTSTTYAAFTATSNASVYFANISKFSPFEKYGNDSKKYKSRIGGSAYFPGAGGGEASYLNVVGANADTLNLSTTPNWTIECWFYCTKITMMDQSLINKDGYNGSTVPVYGIAISPGAYVGATTSTVKAIIGQAASGTYYGNYIIGINRWYHVAFVQNSGSVYLYVNGTLNATSLTRTMGNQNNNLFIGWENNQPWGNHFNGYLSDVRITRRAVYTSAFTPPTLPLLAEPDTILLLNFTNYKIIDYTGNYNLLPRGTISTTGDVVKYNRSSIRFNGYDHIQFLPIPEYSRYRAGLMNTKSQFTVETWIYITSFNSGQDSSGLWNVIYADSDNGSDGNAWFFGFNEYGRPAWYNSGNNVNSTSYVLPLNIWFHIAWVSVYSSTAASSSISCYVNGQLQPFYQSTSTSYTTNQATQEFRPTIGMDRGRGFWSGYIEDLRVTQGIARYTKNFIPPSGPLPKG